MGSFLSPSTVQLSVSVLHFSAVNKVLYHRSVIQYRSLSLWRKLSNPPTLPTFSSSAFFVSDLLACSRCGRTKERDFSALPF